MDNFITEDSTINPNCDTDFINSKLTIISLLLCFEFLLNIIILQIFVKPNSTPTFMMAKR